MNFNVSVFARTAKVGQAVKYFLSENRFELKSSRGWIGQYGSLIVKAIIKRIEHLEWREQVESRVSVTEGA